MPSLTAVGYTMTGCYTWEGRPFLERKEEESMGRKRKLGERTGRRGGRTGKLRSGWKKY